MSNATPFTPAERLIHTVEQFPPGARIRVRSEVTTFYAEVAPGGYGVITDPGPKQGRTFFAAFELLDSGELAQHPTSVWADEAAREDAVDGDRHGSTKVVTMVLTAKFVGDYYGADEVASVLEGWIDSGLEDRDDLRGWGMTHVGVIETEVSPEDRR